METCFEYLIDKANVHTRSDGSKYPYGTFFTDEPKWIRKVLNWVKEYPEDVQLETVGVDDGDRLRVIRRSNDKPIDLTKIDPSRIDSIDVNMPNSWFKVSPPRKSNMSDEQRALLAERMRGLRKKEEQGS